jgi:Ca2+-transporting ATPase
MPANTFSISGLTNNQVELSRIKFGKNKLAYKKENKLFKTVKRLAKDPMTVLLLVASFIYFISGETGDGIFLTLAIVFITSI